MTTFMQQAAASGNTLGALGNLQSPADTPSTGVFGFVHNLWHGAEGLATGLAGLISQGGHDVGRAAGYALDPILPGKGVTLGPIETTDPTGYHLDNITNALLGTGGFSKAGSAIVNDYQQRYGSIAKLKTGLYQQPLSYLLDLLSVGSMVGKGAEIAGAAALATDAGESGARAAMLAARGGDIAANAGGSALETAASKSAELIKGSGFAPGLTRKVANPAGIKAGLDALAGQRELTPIEDLARRILPSASVRRVGSELVPAVGKNNPVTRALETPFHLAATESLDTLRAQAAGYQNEINTAIAAGEAVPGYAARRSAQLRSLVTGAEDAGLTRIQRPIVSKTYAMYASARSVANVRAVGLNVREQRFADIQQVAHPYVTADKTFADRTYGTVQALDTRIPELPEHPGAVNMTGISEARVVHLTDTPVPLTPEIPASVRDWMTRNGQEGILKQVDDAIAVQNDAMAKFRLDPSTLPTNTTLQSAEDGALRRISNLNENVIRAYNGMAPGGKVVSDKIKFTDDLNRMLAGQNWEGSMLMRGDASPDMLLQRSYASEMMKYGAERDLEGRLVMPNGRDWRQIDDAFRASGQAPPAYFKLIKDEHFKTNYGEFTFSNKRVGIKRATYDPSLRAMKGNLLKSGSYVKDPVEVFTRRAAQGTRYEEAQNLVEWAIKPAAHKVSSTDEIIPGVEGYFIPSELRRTFATHMRFDDMRTDLAARGVELDNATAAALHSVVFKNMDEIVSKGITTKGAEIYAIPIELANHLDAYAKYAFNNKAIRLFFDGPMNAWRSFVLSGSPRWTLNNLLGNTVMVALSGGANLTDVVKIGEERFKQMLNDKLGMNLDTSLLDQLHSVEGMSRVPSGFAGTVPQYNPKLGSAAESATGRIFQQIAGSPPMNFFRKLGSYNQRANGAIEDVFRQATYLKALEKTDIIAAAKPVMHGFWDLRKRLETMNKNGYSEGAVNSALTEMYNVMGNYGALGPIERNVVRRFAFPFWAFTKHQGQFLARLPIENPLRAQVLNQLSQVNHDMMTDYGPIPSWLQGATPMAPPGTQGDIPFISGTGPDPFNATFSNPLGQLSPPLQVLLSRLEGHNLYTGAPFTDPNVVTPFGSDQSFRVVRDAHGNVVGTKPIEGGPTPGLLEQLLSQVPQYQGLENVLAGGKTYDSANLLGALASRITGNRAAVTQVTPGTQTPTQPANLASELAKLSGVGVYPYNLSQWQQSLLQNQQRALLEAQQAG